MSAPHPIPPSAGALPAGVIDDVEWLASLLLVQSETIPLDLALWLHLDAASRLDMPQRRLLGFTWAASLTDEADVLALVLRDLNDVIRRTRTGSGHEDEGRRYLLETTVERFVGIVEDRVGASRFHDRYLSLHEQAEQVTR